MTAVVIGCGVSGLSSGIRLLEAGIPTEIWTREPAAETTSSIATAFWYPYKVFPEDLVLDWAATTYTELVKLAAFPGSGVTVHETMEVFPSLTPDPWWISAVPSLRRLAATELPSGCADGYLFDSPVAEMPIYLTYLQQRFEAMGGKISLHPIGSIGEALEHYEIVVNCTGLGARELVGDDTLSPIRGQVVRVSQVGLEQIFIDEYGADGLTYIVPRSQDCILGGTSDNDDERTKPDVRTGAEILTRCIKREPRLAEAIVLEHRAGLRPGRPVVRVEADADVSDALVIHNYGHGGAGIALSWGCADRVVEITRAAG